MVRSTVPPGAGLRNWYGDGPRRLAAARQPTPRADAPDPAGSPDPASSRRADDTTTPRQWTGRRHPTAVRATNRQMRRRSGASPPRPVHSWTAFAWVPGLPCALGPPTRLLDRSRLTPCLLPIGVDGKGQSRGGIRLIRRSTSRARGRPQPARGVRRRAASQTRPAAAAPAPTAAAAIAGPGGRRSLTAGTAATPAGRSRGPASRARPRSCAAALSGLTARGWPTASSIGRSVTESL